MLHSPQMRAMCIFNGILSYSVCFYYHFVEKKEEMADNELNLNKNTIMNTQGTYSVFLVDDDKMFLTSLKNNLQKKFGSLLKIQEYTTGEQCIEDIEVRKNNEDEPDIVILDYYLDDGSHPDALNGVKVLQEVKSLSKDTTVIMLSGEDRLQVAVDCVKHGAYEYVVKSESALVRIQQVLKNAIDNAKTARRSKGYFKANVAMAAIIIAIILIDVIWYYSYHYSF